MNAMAENNTPWQGLSLPEVWKFYHPFLDIYHSYYEP